MTTEFEKEIEKWIPKDITLDKNGLLTLDVDSCKNFNEWLSKDESNYITLLNALNGSKQPFVISMETQITNLTVFPDLYDQPDSLRKTTEQNLKDLTSNTYNENVLDLVTTELNKPNSPIRNSLRKCITNAYLVMEQNEDALYFKNNYLDNNTGSKIVAVHHSLQSDISALLTRALLRVNLLESIALAKKSSETKGNSSSNKVPNASEKKPELNDVKEDDYSFDLLEYNGGNYEEKGKVLKKIMSLATFEDESLLNICKNILLYLMHHKRMTPKFR